jgi:hypothetical protein
MIRIASLLSIPPVLALAWLVADSGGLSLVGTMAAILVIVGFAVAAVGWTMRRDV